MYAQEMSTKVDLGSMGELKPLKPGASREKTEGLPSEGLPSED